MPKKIFFSSRKPGLYDLLVNFYNKSDSLYSLVNVNQNGKNKLIHCWMIVARLWTTTAKNHTDLFIIINVESEYF